MFSHLRLLRNKLLLLLHFKTVPLDNHAAFCYSNTGTVWYSNPHCTLNIQANCKYCPSWNYNKQMQLIVKCVNNTKLDPTEIYFFNFQERRILDTLRNWSLLINIEAKFQQGKIFIWCFRKVLKLPIVVSNFDRKYCLAASGDSLGIPVMTSIIKKSFQTLKVGINLNENRKEEVACYHY